MRIDILLNVNQNYPEDKIVCLNSFTNKDIDELIICLYKLLDNKRIKLSSENFISYSSNEVILEVYSDDIGFILNSSNIYECLLTSVKYIEIIDILKNYKNTIPNINIYNWLYDLNNPIEFLLSQNCKW